MSNPDRAWQNWAIARIEADFTRSADTHLIPLELPTLPEIAIYLKDESSHPTGSLKHRLARSLFLYALCNGWITEGKTVVEASSGSTAVSEAYFARMLNLPFVAVMPACTAIEKVAAIEALGGRCHPVDNGGMVYAEAARLADELGGHYMDQFTFAERATDWRGNNNIAQSIFAQMAREPVPHLCHFGPLCPIPLPQHADLRGRPDRIGVSPSLAGPRHRQSLRHPVPDRRHRPTACGTELRPNGHRPYGSGGRCDQHRGGTCAEPSPWATGRWVDRHEHGGYCPAGNRHGGVW
jgi:hypothetical protein